MRSAELVLFTWATTIVLLAIVGGLFLLGGELGIWHGEGDDEDDEDDG